MSRAGKGGDSSRKQLQAIVNGYENDESEHAEGTVVKIRLQNFVTYTCVEVTPGPYLNVIIGPNGTGKSSIVSAICLGLAGKTSILNRTTQVSGFIQYGSAKAVIEIELFNPDGENYHVKREIHRDNKSEFYLNDERVPQKRIEELTSRLNIQVGNLCQFLPQEKVADFAKMSQQDLLENTEKAAGPPGMYDRHQELKHARDKGRRMQLDTDNMQELLQQETQKNARLETDVKNYEEKKQNLKKIKMLKMKRAWQIYEDKRVAYVTAKKDKDKLDKEMKDAKNEHLPLKNKLETAKKKVKDADSLIKEIGGKVKEHAQKASTKSKDIEELTEKIQDVKEELKAKKETNAGRLKRINDVKQQLQAAQDELDDLQDAENVQPALELCNEKTCAVNTEITARENESTQIRLNINAHKNECSGHETSLRQMKDIDKQRLEHLRRYNKDAYEAVQWLRANKDRFKGNVYEPMMLTVNMKNPDMNKFVEASIGPDMLAFVCEDGDDVQLLMQEVRDRQNLKITGVMAPREPLGHFLAQQAPIIDQYRRYDFHNYIIDFIEAPDAVLAYLCQIRGIHKILVGTKKTYDKFDQVIANCPQLTKFYTPDFFFSVSTSRYGNRNKTTQKSAIRTKNLLGSSADTERIQEVTQRIAELRATIEDLEKRHTESSKKAQAANQQLEKLRKEKADLIKKKDKRKQVARNIKSKQDRISQVESECIDMAAEERRAKQKIHQHNLKKCNYAASLKDHTKQILDLSIDKVRTTISYTMVSSQLVAIEDEIREKTTNLHDLTARLDLKKEELKALKDEARVLLVEAKRTSGTSMDEDLSDDLKKAFETIPCNIDYIDNEIHEEQARVDCVYDTDERVIEEYNRRKIIIAKLTKDLETSTTSKEEHQAQIEEVKEAWIEPIQELIARINHNFARFFAYINCAGEIELNVPECQDDYEKYGIRIKVMYRSGEQLRELNSYTQSGGERSVATVLYMLALQELTNCPFRCVDEINQGMDPVNERKVFELIVETACNNNSQYFLLTPKLLPDLPYSDKMMVICIFNGPGMMPNEDWNLKKFLRRRSKITS